MIKKLKPGQVRRKFQEEMGTLHSPQNAYIVMGTQRSGSNLLCYGLRDMGYGLPVETFNIHQNRKHAWGYNENDIYKYIQTALLSQTSPQTDVFGMKIFWDQLVYFLNNVKHLGESHGIVLSDTKWIEVFFPNAILIFLQRKDKVLQAISNAKSFQSGIWILQKGKDQDSNQRKPVYDADLISYYFAQILAQSILWQNFLIEQNLKPLKLWYEDLASDYERTMQIILNSFCVKREYIPPPKTRKQADNINTKWYQRFYQENPWLESYEIRKALDQEQYHTVLATWILNKEKPRKHRSFYQHTTRVIKKGQTLFAKILNK
jgi:LPS sulfotransferase NodH